MTDLELLELAAKAARIKKDDSPCNGGGFEDYPVIIRELISLRDWLLPMLMNDQDTVR